MQAVVSRTVHVPPATQVFVPLCLKKGLPLENPLEGILLTPSNAVSRTPSLVGDFTMVPANCDLFIQIVNTGHEPIVIQEGTTLAHATAAQNSDGGCTAAV